MQATLLITVLALSAPAPKEAPPKTIVGEWQTERVERAGKDAGPDPSVWIFFADGTFGIYVGGKNTLSKPWLYSVDLASKPMTIDLIQPNDDDPNRFRGIIKFEGDKLIMCLAEIEKPRPNEFASSFWKSHTLVVFKRVKKKD
jgi:uncharacterized protein (TIGR03067 family)